MFSVCTCNLHSAHCTIWIVLIYCTGNLHSALTNKRDSFRFCRLIGRSNSSILYWSFRFLYGWLVGRFFHVNWSLRFFQGWLVDSIFLRSFQFVNGWLVVLIRPSLIGRTIFSVVEWSNDFSTLIFYWLFNFSKVVPIRQWMIDCSYISVHGWLVDENNPLLIW